MPRKPAPRRKSWNISKLDRYEDMIIEQRIAGASLRGIQHHLRRHGVTVSVMSLSRFMRRMPAAGRLRGLAPEAE